MKHAPAGLKRLGQLAFSIILKDLKRPEFRPLFSPRITGELILPKGRGGYWPGGRPDTLVGPGAGDRSVPATWLEGGRRGTGVSRLPVGPTLLSGQRFGTGVSPPPG